MKQLFVCTAFVCSIATSVFAQDAPTPAQPSSSKQATSQTPLTGGLNPADIVRQQGDSDAAVAAKTVQALSDEAIGTRRDALADFKQGAGLGISVALGSKEDSIEDAIIIDNKIVVTRRSKDQPRAAFEIHHFFTTNVFTAAGRREAVNQMLQCGVDRIQCPMLGVGPFAVVETGDNDTVSSVGIGVMFGARSDPRQGASFNIGLGIAFGSRTKALANGFTEGQAPPAGATAVTFTEKSQRRMLLALSFAF